EINNCTKYIVKLVLKDHDIITSLHPISYVTSYWKFKEDYEVLFDGLDPRYMGYTPDAGHIEFGGMEAADIIKEALPLVKHVHFKDASKNNVWKKMGEVDIDFVKCVNVLKDGDYDGWIILEEETGAAKDTSEVIVELGDYVKKNIYPIVKGE